MTESSTRGVPLRSVTMPAEHGGWGLTLEPGILAVLVAPSAAALLLAVAAVGLFLARTPLRLVLVGRRRAVRPTTALVRQRQALAARVAAMELAAVVAVVAVVAWLAADPRWWLPGVAAVPLLGVSVWFDIQACSRQLVPEVVGSIAIAGVAPMGALAGGSTMPLAIGLWLILGARVASSIPHVRAQVARIHGRHAASAPGLVGDIAALLAAVVAALLDPALVAGTVAIAALIAVQRVTLQRPPRPARVLGVRQMILGFAVVGATAVGTWVL